MNNLEKVLYYPIAIISTMVAAAAWTEVHLLVALALTLLSLALWAAPFFKNARWGRWVFWILAVFLLVWGVYVALWALGSR